MEDTLILVDLEDRETGTGPKLQVHRENRLHRAFSVFIVDGDRMLIQRRAYEAAARELFSFVYFQQYDGLSEYEYDHVFLAEYSGDVCYDISEVEEVMWVDISELVSDVESNPQKYCTWFIIALPKVLKYLRKYRYERE